MEAGISAAVQARNFFQRCHQALRPGGLLCDQSVQWQTTGNPYAGTYAGKQIVRHDILQVAVEEGNILLYSAARQLFLQKTGRCVSGRMTRVDAWLFPLKALHRKALADQRSARRLIKAA